MLVVLRPEVAAVGLAWCLVSGVVQYLRYDEGVFNTSDDFDRALAVAADGDVDIEDAL